MLLIFCDSYCIYILFFLQTPLHLAVLTGNAEITNMLLSFGAQPSVKDSNGNTAFHLAVLHGHLDCVKAILNTNNTKSLSLDDFNDEGKCMN
jgi:ankyrin repeat protein